jgi:hypothetical protein
MRIGNTLTHLRTDEQDFPVKSNYSAVIVHIPMLDRKADIQEDVIAALISENSS